MTRAGKAHAGRHQLYWVADNVIADHYPEVDRALRDPDGLLAIGGDMTAARLMDAYPRGIFPWYNEGQPILWWSPDPRCILLPDEVRISRSLRKTLTETWITDDVIRAYLELHHAGHALSVECWQRERLVGGLYGLVIGRVYFGESMFSHVSDASKVALVHLAEMLKARNFRLIDCQVHSRHLQNLGAKPIPRKLFVNILEHYCSGATPADWPAESVLI